MKYWVGLNEGVRQVFPCDYTPSRGLHGTQYGAVIGPFKTKRGAEFMAEHGHNNPHCRTVADAERLAKRTTT